MSSSSEHDIFFVIFFLIDGHFPSFLEPDLKPNPNLQQQTLDPPSSVKDLDLKQNLKKN